VSPGRARPGVAWMHASHDVIAAYKEFANGALTVGDYLASFTKPLAFANFAFDDPLPAIVELPVAAWNRFAHGRLGALRAKLAQKIARKFGMAARRVAK
jgi:predicted ATP-grasp superfamily ATP-dependent carboligase